MSSVTSACSSSSSSAAAVAPIEPVSTDEVADEVKVFRTNDAEESMDIASSSAELNADKKDLALEAEIESQTEPIAVAQRMLNPLQSAAMNFPSPSYDFLFPLFMPSPLSPIQAYAATAAAAAYTAVQASQNPLLKMCSASMSPNVAAVANAAHHLAAAAAIARHSPSYLQLGAGWNPGTPLAPPAFGIGSPGAGSLLQQMSQTHGGFNPASPHYQHALQQQQMQQLNSPLISMSSAINGMTLADQQRKQQRQQQLQQQRSASNQQHAGQSSHTPRAMKTSKSAPSSASKQQSSKSSGHPSDHSGQKDNGHVKKPCNAFMWYMKVNRAKLLEQEDCQQKQSALLNQKLGKMWQSMSKKDQQPYYDMAANEREEHQQRYPNWTARENYAIHKKNKSKKKREKSMENNEQKKCRARFGVENQAQWCKHCRRKKRCLNVRDSDSPVMVSSTSGSGAFHQPGAGTGSSHLSALHHPANFYDMASSQSAFLAGGGVSATTAHSSALSSPYSSSSGGVPTTSSSKSRSESNYSSESAGVVNCTPPPQSAVAMRAIKMDTGEMDDERTPKAQKNASPINSTPAIHRPPPYQPQIADSFQQMLNLPFGGGMMGGLVSAPSVTASPTTATTGYLANPSAH